MSARHACNFCGKSDREVPVMVVSWAGTAAICAECVLAGAALMHRKGECTCPRCQDAALAVRQFESSQPTLREFGK